MPHETQSPSEKRAMTDVQTQVMPANERSIAQAAQILRSGGLVAFPTETVYGLGANALAPAAVAGIFAAKGRPGTNPVIVHVGSMTEAVGLANSWPALATTLAERFWPGPLTMVVPAGPRIPPVVTAGGPTVGLRMPAHPVALRLLEAAGVPIAAPSANRSSQISPTRAEHVLASLGGRIPLILDGGQCPGGIESTVIDLTVTPPRLLRPGLVPVPALESVIGPVTVDVPGVETGPARSPGLLARHYAPTVPLECVPGDGLARVQQLARQGVRVGWLALGTPGDVSEPSALHLAMPHEPSAYAAQLYAALHILDAAGVERIVVALPPKGAAWAAVHDRLRRASAAADPRA
jgi:L-threonylcarbamoyladenylate synthase